MTPEIMTGAAVTAAVLALVLLVLIPVVATVDDTVTATTARTSSLEEGTSCAIPPPIDTGPARVGQGDPPAPREGQPKDNVRTATFALG